MKFWDSSAIISVIDEQPGHEHVKAVLDVDPDVVVWWGTRVELASGFCRLRREGLINENELADSLEAGDELIEQADEIDPTEQVRETAMHVVRVHSLRAADSFQLAAALVWSENNPSGEGFVCLDKRLREAAHKEGFNILP